MQQNNGSSFGMSLSWLQCLHRWHKSQKTSKQASSWKQKTSN